MAKDTLQVLQQIIQDFPRVFDHFAGLSLKHLLRHCKMAWKSLILVSFFCEVGTQNKTDKWYPNLNPFRRGVHFRKLH